MGVGVVVVGAGSTSRCGSCSDRNYAVPCGIGSGTEILGSSFVYLQYLCLENKTKLLDLVAGIIADLDYFCPDPDS
jgi:hypothetical protein